MKTIITTIILTFFSAAIFAQAEQKLSLQEAIEMGLKNRFDLRANKYNADIANNAVKKNKNEWIPDIHASGDVRYNAQLQSTIIPAGFAGSTKEQLFTLGSKNNTIFGLDLNQPLFNPSINTDVKISQDKAELEKEKIRENETNVKTKISQAYLNVLLKELQLEITRKNESRYKEYFDLFEGRYNKGALIESDLLTVKLDYENARVQSLQSRQQYQQAIATLKYTINIPAETRLVLTDALTEQQLPDGGLVVPVENRPEIKQLFLQQRINQLQITGIHQSNLPTVSFFANYSQQFLNGTFNYTDGQWWSPFSYLGIKASIPISSHLKNKTNTLGYNLQVKQTEMQIKQKVADLDYELSKSKTELEDALQNSQITKKNYDLANTLYEKQKQQYALGSFQYTNLLDTEKALNTAEQNYLKAVFDYLVAKINYQRASGSL